MAHSDCTPRTFFLPFDANLDYIYIWRRLLICLRVTGLNLGDSEKEYFGVHSANIMMREAEAWGFAVMFVR